MKPELKHIAPYALHGAKGVFMLSDVIDIHPLMDEKRIKVLTVDNIGFFVAHCTIVLRPLSDLAKEIAHNGKIFNPIKEIVKLTKGSNALTAYYGLNTVGLVDYLEDIADYNAVNPCFLSYPLAQKLIEWHFDIHGLIEKGLAININELNKRK